MKDTPKSKQLGRKTGHAGEDAFLKEVTVSDAGGEDQHEDGQARLQWSLEGGERPVQGQLLFLWQKSHRNPLNVGKEKETEAHLSLPKYSNIMMTQTILGLKDYLFFVCLFLPSQDFLLTIMHFEQLPEKDSTKKTIWEIFPSEHFLYLCIWKCQTTVLPIPARPG